METPQISEVTAVEIKALGMCCGGNHARNAQITSVSSPSLNEMISP
jgi:hypothetical protein